MTSLRKSYTFQSLLKNITLAYYLLKSLELISADSFTKNNL